MAGLSLVSSMPQPASPGAYHEMQNTADERCGSDECSEQVIQTFQMDLDRPEREDIDCHQYQQDSADTMPFPGKETDEQSWETIKYDSQLKIIEETFRKTSSGLFVNE